MTNKKMLAVIGVAAIICCLSCNEETDKSAQFCEAPSGQCWDWICDGDGCGLHTTAEIDTEGFPECEDGDVVVIGMAWDRFVHLHLTCQDPNGSAWGIFPREGRVVICETNDGCPRVEADGHGFECASGICQSTNTDAFPRDVITYAQAEYLCLSGFERSETVTLEWLQEHSSQVQIDIGVACPTTAGPCTGELPDYCLKP